MTGYLPVVSVASLLAADTPSEQLPSDTLYQTWASQCCTASGRRLTLARPAGQHNLQTPESQAQSWRHLPRHNKRH